MITEADLDENAWASCGPASLAALLDVPLTGVRVAFPRQTPSRTWTNFAQMEAAVRQLARVDVTLTRGLAAFPRRGVVLIQFGGTWDRLPDGHPAQLRHTHWIAVVPKGAPLLGGFATQNAVFDVNAVGWEQTPGGWMSFARWGNVLAPQLAADQSKGGDGRWRVRAGIEVIVEPVAAFREATRAPEVGS